MMEMMMMQQQQEQQYEPEKHNFQNKHAQEDQAHCTI